MLRRSRRSSRRWPWPTRSRLPSRNWPLCGSFCGSLASADGLVDAACLLAVPAARSARQARIPSVWDPGEVARIVEAIDRDNPCGKRDYAIILLITRLGLRGVDIRGLEFADFDWRGNRLGRPAERQAGALRRRLVPGGHGAPRPTRKPLRDEIAGVLSTMGLRLSEEKTLVTHIDEGLDFLGWHIQRRRKRGTNRRYVYTYPSRKALRAVAGKVKIRCRCNINLPLETLLRQLNPVLRGWTNHFRPGVSSIAFGYLRAFTWRQVIGWIRRRTPEPQRACGAPDARRRARPVRGTVQGNGPGGIPAPRPGPIPLRPHPHHRPRLPPRPPSRGAFKCPRHRQPQRRLHRHPQ